jgi:hypothetical protein
MRRNSVVASGLVDLRGDAELPERLRKRRVDLRTLGECVEHESPGVRAAVGDLGGEAALFERIHGARQSLVVGGAFELGVGRAGVGEREGHAAPAACW